MFQKLSVDGREFFQPGLLELSPLKHTLFPIGLRMRRYRIIYMNETGAPVILLRRFFQLLLNFNEM